MRSRRLSRLLICLALVASGAGYAQTSTVTARVELLRNAKAAKDASNVVVWLAPVSESITATPALNAPQHRWQLVQRGKHFEPHLLVVPVGAAVEFPNKDLFFHNVFSLFEGKRFDLGLYEAGSTRTVHFDKPGISYIFCNIHSEMSAVVIALATPYYAVSDRAGDLVIPDVPAGRYRLHLFYESSSPEQLNAFTREITVSAANQSLGPIRLTDAGAARLAHKNKYGKDYDDPTPATPGYAR